MSEVTRLYEYFFGGPEAEARQEGLGLDPGRAARVAASELGAEIDIERAKLVTGTMARSLSDSSPAAVARLLTGPGRTKGSST